MQKNTIFLVLLDTLAKMVDKDKKRPIMNQPKIIAYMKPSCGWSNGVRAVLKKYHLAFEDRDIINNPNYYQEMVVKSGQPLQPTLDVDGKILADVSGDEVEAWLVQNGYIQASSAPAEVPTNEACQSHDAPNVDFSSS